MGENLESGQKINLIKIQNKAFSGKNSEKDPQN